MTKFGKTSVVSHNLAPVHPDTFAAGSAWGQLRALSAGQVRLLGGPAPAARGLCGVCRGPVRTGSARCYQCQLQAECAPDGLADLVVPVAYAPKGGQHAQRLWRYKSGREGAGDAAAALRLLLLAFLGEHGSCLWREAGVAGPSHLAVVPSGRGRQGPHPLRALVGPYLSAPWAPMTARPGAGPSRDLDPGRFQAKPAPGATVLLLDDTWTSGASAQSAAMALRQAGARAVFVVDLGRHLTPAGPGEPRLPPAALRLRQDLCAVHDVRLPARPAPAGTVLAVARRASAAT